MLIYKTGITNELQKSSSAFNCTFFEQGEECSCAVNISYNANCSELLGEYSTSCRTSSVIVTVPFRGDVQQYCYVARGTCDGITAVVEGTVNIAVPTHSKFEQFNHCS